MNVQCSPASQRLPMLSKESGNPGIMCAKVVSLGKFLNFKFAVPFEYEYFPFATFTVIKGALLFRFLTVVLVVTKVLVVPESSIADSCFVYELQHKSFEWVSMRLEFIFFTLMHLVVLHSTL